MLFAEKFSLIEIFWLRTSRFCLDKTIHATAGGRVMVDGDWFESAKAPIELTGCWSAPGLRSNPNTRDC